MLEDPGETCFGGWNVFHDPSKVLPKFTPNFTIFSRKTKAPRRWDPGNRVRTSSEGPRRQKSVFLSSYFCFSPKSQLLNDFGTRKSIKTRKYFLKWRKTQNKKVVSSFLIFRANFFFSIANNSKTRGDRAILSKKLAEGRNIFCPKYHLKKFQRDRARNKKVMLHLSLKSGASASQDAIFIPLTQISISMVILVD